MHDINNTLLERLIQTEKNILYQKEKEINSLPKGTLIVKRRKDKTFFYRRESGRDTGITKNTALIYKLARRSQLSKETPIHYHNIDVLNKAAQKIKVPSLAAKGNNILDNALYSPNENNWRENMASSNPYKRENLIYKTSSGILVRSKSERIIADRLYSYGIIFRYEYPLEIHNKIIYPDFAILRSDGKIVLWEHNGLMGNEDYLLNTFQKIRRYAELGFLQHTNLICTEESDILDTEILDDIISRFILL